MPPGLSASPGRVSEFVIEACTVVPAGMVTAAATALLRKLRRLRDKMPILLLILLTSSLSFRFSRPGLRLPVYSPVVMHLLRSLHAKTINGLF
jgi:hypothetical protein